MPSTLPGFLLIAGLVLFVVSFLKGPVEIKQLKFPRLRTEARVIFGILGVIFLGLSAYMYIEHWNDPQNRPLPLMAPVLPDSLVSSETKALGINTRNTSLPAGSGRWDWTVFLDSDRNTLSRIRCVEYTLHPTFTDPIRTVCEPANGFAFSSNSWGTFAIKIKIMFKDGSTKYLTHMLSFNYQ